MPGFIAKRLCPKLVFVRPDFAKYSAAAEETRAVFREYDPDFQVRAGPTQRRPPSAAGLAALWPVCMGPLQGPRSTGQYS